MKRLKLKLLALVALALCASCNSPEQPKSRQQLLSDFVDMRHGMFICFNIMSYGAKWSEANYPIESFNPSKLDCDQWAKAAVSANMSFGILTTKHHEGFALWDSSVNEYDVANSPYKRDIVAQYADAFRRNGLKVGLYYSIWDSTNGVEIDGCSPEKIDFVKQEIRELLSNYGKIDYFIVDGWYWRMGHREVPFVEIRELIRSLQPDCLLTDHTHLQAPYHVDVPYFEGPFGAFPPEGNTMASALGHCPAKGNGWFWNEATPSGMYNSAADIVELLKSCESRYCNFMLNCMPNRDGLLDQNYIELLSEIGDIWSPDTTRPALPEQYIVVSHEAQIESATASSGEASNLIAAQQLGTDYTMWVSDESRTQQITLDMGRVYGNINILNFVQAHNCKPAPERALPDGNITRCTLSTSIDCESFEFAADGSWQADAKMRTMIFEDRAARYLRLEISEFEGDRARIIETQVGNYLTPLKLQ